MIGNARLALETGEDVFWFSWGSVDQICMWFAGRHEGYLTRTCVRRVHVDSNLAASSASSSFAAAPASAAPASAAEAQSQARSQAPLLPTKRVVASRTITSHGTINIFPGGHRCVSVSSLPSYLPVAPTQTVRGYLGVKLGANAGMLVELGV